MRHIRIGATGLVLLVLVACGSGGTPGAPEGGDGLAVDPVGTYRGTLATERETFTLEVVVGPQSGTGVLGDSEWPAAVAGYPAESLEMICSWGGLSPEDFSCGEANFDDAETFRFFSLRGDITETTWVGDSALYGADSPRDGSPDRGTFSLTRE